MSQYTGLAERKVPRLRTPVGTVTRTKQSMAAACDINNIMAKFVKSGSIDHFAKHGAHYGDFPAVDFREAQEILLKGQAMFDDLPAKVRNKFHNSPFEFLEFVQDPKNLDSLREMGLAKPLETAPNGAGSAG